ncbi:hypothetical protein [Calothrix sp. PCC 7507]|uniref:hypothetical protein n=1 Tax=Calothrix sp. PCC 7507 TaxID=99598 RepID=UPI000300C78B|nr:hypothetical protein [Calothrix sp. PCC 7507]
MPPKSEILSIHENKYLLSSAVYHPNCKVLQRQPEIVTHITITRYCFGDRYLTATLQ